MRNEKELTRKKEELLGNVEGPIKIGEHGYLVAPVYKVKVFSRCAQQVRARYTEMKKIN